MSLYLLNVLSFLVLSGCGDESEKTQDTSSNSTTEDTGTDTGNIETTSICGDGNIDYQITQDQIGYGGYLDFVLYGDPSMNEGSYTSDDYRITTLVVCNDTDTNIVFTSSRNAEEYGWSDGGLGEGCIINMRDTFTLTSAAPGIATADEVYDNPNGMWEIPPGTAYTFAAITYDVQTESCESDYGVSFPNDETWTAPFTVDPYE